jgi:hypothetical protein
LFREDNLAVYYKLEEATRATSYSASIKLYQRTKNGRYAWLALSNQYAGKDLSRVLELLKQSYATWLASRHHKRSRGSAKRLVPR